MKNGFSLIEVIVVLALITLFASLMAGQFSRTRILLEESLSVLTSDIQIAKSRSISSTKYGGLIRCGYGIRYVDANRYSIYVGPNAATTNCASINRNYSSSEDEITETKSLNDQRVEFAFSFNDIFFEPPHPKTYLNNDSALTAPPLTITVKKKGGTCPNDCKSIRIYTSGKLEAI
ncbi:MAG TPA: prepilin-type N-terminal cleavage/methylation domain-containing protein [Candidatus Paceibacterota bacterium]